MLYVPDPFAVAEYGPWVVPSGQVSTVLVTVAPGVAFPTKYTFVIPTVGLEGDNDPVSVTPSQVPTKKDRRIDDRQRCRRKLRTSAGKSAFPVPAPTRDGILLTSALGIDAPSLDTSGCIDMTPRNVQSSNDASSKQELEVRNCY